MKARYIGPGIVTIATPAGSFTLESGSEQTIELPEGEVASSTIWEAAADSKPAKADAKADASKADAPDAKTKD